MNQILSVEQLTKTFTMHTLHSRIIKGCTNVSYSLDLGEVLGLSGPSGTGKSSVLKCIYRAYLPTSGALQYDSERVGRVDLAQLDEHRIIVLRQFEIGYVTQFLNVIPRVSAVDTVAEPLLQNGVPLEEARHRASELLERLYIPANLFDACPVTFSGGEQQRVNFAAGVISSPRMLLLDEPTASLDVKTRQAVIDILNELKGRGTTMIAIFHDQEIMSAVADNLYFMDGVIHPEQEAV